MTEGNMTFGGKNPYLESTDWAGRSIRWACALPSTRFTPATRSR